VESTAGSWVDFGSRATSLMGCLPRSTCRLILSSPWLPKTDCEIALCFSRAEEKFPARLIKPGEVEVEIRVGLMLHVKSITS